MCDFNSVEYKRSRAAYMAQCTIYYFLMQLTADSFLAKLLGSLGIGDALIGIISSFVSLAFMVQVFSVFMVRLKISTKKLVIFCDTASFLFFMLLYLVPFIPVNREQRTILVIVSVIAAYVSNYLISPICFKWANSYVQPEKRASYSATKEMVSLFSGMAFTMVIGFVIDRYEGLGNREGGFLFIAVSIFILNFCNFICFMLIRKEDEKKRLAAMHPLSDVLRHIFGNPDFRHVILLTVLWDAARYFTIGFMGIFKTKELMLSVFAVQAVNTAANLVRLAVTKPLGKYSDRHSYAKGFQLGLYLAAGAFLVNMFTTEKTWFLVILYTVLYHCCLAGTNMNSFHITYSYVDETYITQAMAVKNSIGGLCGFLASILAGRILAAVQANGNMVFGVHVYGQQLLSGISFLIVVIAIVFTGKVIVKQPVTVR